jgi:hypothetical protein
MTRAFTLMETVITIALSAVIMLAIANLYINFNSLYVYQQTFVATTNAASSAIQALNTAVLPADQVVASHSFGGTTITSSASTLVLEVPSISSTGDIIAGTHDYIAFYRTGTDLYQRTDAGAGSARSASTKRVAALVDATAFSYDTADITQATRVSADVTTRLNTKKGVVQTTLHGQFYLRNKQL